MDTLIVGGVAAAVAAVVGFLVGRGIGRTSGGSTDGAPARSSPSGETAGDDTSFRLGLSRIGAYLRENVDGPLAAAFKDRSLSLRRAAEDAVGAIEDLHFFLEDPAGQIGEDDLVRIVKEGHVGHENRDLPVFDIEVSLGKDADMPAASLCSEHHGQGTVLFGFYRVDGVH